MKRGHWFSPVVQIQIFARLRNIKRKTTGATIINVIYITPNCFRELCMLSQTTKAKLVRKYFIEMVLTRQARRD